MRTSKDSVQKVQAYDLYQIQNPNLKKSFSKKEQITHSGTSNKHSSSTISQQKNRNTSTKPSQQEKSQLQKNLNSLSSLTSFNNLYPANLLEPKSTRTQENLYHPQNTLTQNSKQSLKNLTQEQSQTTSNKTLSQQSQQDLTQNKKNLLLKNSILKKLAGNKSNHVQQQQYQNSIQVPSSQSQIQSPVNNNNNGYDMGNFSKGYQQFQTQENIISSHMIGYSSTQNNNNNNNNSLSSNSNIQSSFLQGNNGNSTVINNNSQKYSEGVKANHSNLSQKAASSNQNQNQLQTQNMFQQRQDLKQQKFINFDKQSYFQNQLNKTYNNESIEHSPRKKMSSTNQNFQSKTKQQQQQKQENQGIQLQTLESEPQQKRQSFHQYSKTIAPQSLTNIQNTQMSNVIQDILSSPQTTQSQQRKQTRTNSQNTLLKQNMLLHQKTRSQQFQEDIFGTNNQNQNQNMNNNNSHKNNHLKSSNITQRKPSIMREEQEPNPLKKVSSVQKFVENVPQQQQQTQQKPREFQSAQDFHKSPQHNHNPNTQESQQNPAQMKKSGSYYQLGQKRKNSKDKITLKDNNKPKTQATSKGQNVGIFKEGFSSPKSAKEQQFSSKQKTSKVSITQQNYALHNNNPVHNPTKKSITQRKKSSQIIDTLDPMIQSVKSSRNPQLQQSVHNHPDQPSQPFYNQKELHDQFHSMNIPMNNHTNQIYNNHNNNFYGQLKTETDSTTDPYLEKVELKKTQSEHKSGGVIQLNFNSKKDHPNNNNHIHHQQSLKQTKVSAFQEVYLDQYEAKTDRDFIQTELTKGKPQVEKFQLKRQSSINRQNSNHNDHKHVISPKMKHKQAKKSMETLDLQLNIGKTPTSIQNNSNKKHQKQVKEKGIDLPHYSNHIPKPSTTVKAPRQQSLNVKTNKQNEVHLNNNNINNHNNNRNPKEKYHVNNLQNDKNYIKQNIKNVQNAVKKDDNDHIDLKKKSVGQNLREAKLLGQIDLNSLKQAPNPEKKKKILQQQKRQKQALQNVLAEISDLDLDLDMENSSQNKSTQQQQQSNFQQQELIDIYNQQQNEELQIQHKLEDLSEKQSIQMNNSSPLGTIQKQPPIKPNNGEKQSESSSVQYQENSEYLPQEKSGREVYNNKNEQKDEIIENQENPYQNLEKQASKSEKNEPAFTPLRKSKNTLTTFSKPQSKNSSPVKKQVHINQQNFDFQEKNIHKQQHENEEENPYYEDKLKQINQRLEKLDNEKKKRSQTQQNQNNNNNENNQCSQSQAQNSKNSQQNNYYVQKSQQNNHNKSEKSASNQKMNKSANNQMSSNKKKQSNHNLKNIQSVSNFAQQQLQKEENTNTNNTNTNSNSNNNNQSVQKLIGKSKHNVDKLIQETNSILNQKRKQNKKTALDQLFRQILNNNSDPKDKQIAQLAGLLGVNTSKFSEDMKYESLMQNSEFKKNLKKYLEEKNIQKRKKQILELQQQQIKQQEELQKLYDQEQKLLQQNKNKQENMQESNNQEDQQELHAPQNIYKLRQKMEEFNELLNANNNSQIQLNTLNNISLGSPSCYNINEKNIKYQEEDSKIRFSQLFDMENSPVNKNFESILEQFLDLEENNEDNEEVYN